jgi:peroxiredoxin
MLMTNAEGLSVVPGIDKVCRANVRSFTGAADASSTADLRRSAKLR